MHEPSGEVGTAQREETRLPKHAGSYPPVESVVRALEILREVNRLKTASVRDLHKATGQNKSTIVRMLETLIDAEYVVSDKLCGGYRITNKVKELVSGYDASSRIIDVVRPFAVDLTERFNWLVGLGFLDGDCIAKQLYTGAISPWSHSSGVIRRRAKLSVTAMGRAYLAFCPADELESLLNKLLANGEISSADEPDLRRTLSRTRSRGYSIRDPRIEPLRMTTIAKPICQGGRVAAVMSCTFYKSVIDDRHILTHAVKPLSEAVSKIESAIATGEVHSPFQT